MTDVVVEPNCRCGHPWSDHFPERNGRRPICDPVADVCSCRAFLPIRRGSDADKLAQRVTGTVAALDGLAAAMRDIADVKFEAKLWIPGDDE